MDYTLTRIDPNGENDRYPLQKQEIVTDPLEQEVNKNVFMGKLNDMVNWGRKNSIWPYNFGLSCCYVEMVTSFTAVHDVARFGAEVLRASPRQADLMVVAGTCFTKMAPVIQRLYDQMLEPKWVYLNGCLCQLWWYVRYLFRLCRASINSSPVDVYIPGCPPRPEAYMQALMLLQESIGKERRPLSWVVGDQGVYRANMQSERERKRGERIAVTNLRTPDEI
ncbi:NADH dehydrogenase I subunit B [Escherichia coli]|uniref:NUO2 n=1 Tax=Escherichia coli TaxID=562 RepID=A0A376KRY8_ECOLX|nr:NADH dehydrogenase I subunit B [Escherichia coli]